MKVKAIELDGEELPSAVTVVMTRDEALYLTLLVGKMSGVQAEEVMDGGGEASAEVYECLTGSLFNRFYEDGAADALRAR